eukprot:scaffold70873_cov69-Phaeocystis_antarctica.AAC.7
MSSGKLSVYEGRCTPWVLVTVHVVLFGTRNQQLQQQLSVRQTDRQTDICHNKQDLPEPQQPQPAASPRS